MPGLLFVYQVIEVLPIAVSIPLHREKGLEPKKPRYALSGLGWALFITRDESK